MLKPRECWSREGVCDWSVASHLLCQSHSENQHPESLATCLCIVHRVFHGSSLWKTEDKGGLLCLEINLAETRSLGQSEMYSRSAFTNAAATQQVLPGVAKLLFIL